MSGAYHQMHDEHAFFDVDEEVDAISKVIVRLEDALTENELMLAEAVSKAISDLRYITFVEAHLEHLAVNGDESDEDESDD